MRKKKHDNDRSVGKEDRCGWLKDKYGVSWQIVPNLLGELMSGPDKKKTENVMQAVMTKVKLDVSALQ